MEKLASSWEIVLVLVQLVLAEQHDAPLPNQSVKRDPNTKLIFFGTRHGNRNPGKFLNENPKRKWGLEGDVELTQYGKRQGYGLGKSLREFANGWLDKNYLPTEAKFYSSSANRCQMTLQVALAGLYPPSSFADWNNALMWTPVPYTIDDPMLRMYAVKCPTSDKAWQPITDDTLPDLVALTKAKKPLLNYIAQKTHWNASISDAADLADNLIEIQLFNAPYPDWIEHPTLPGYDKKRLIKEIMEFAENHQIECANYAPCRNMMGGVWLKNILDMLGKAAGKGDPKLPKVVGYASHTEVTLSLMKLMGIEKHEITTSAGFVLEYRDKPMKSVRLLNHDPNPIDKHVIYQAKYLPPLAKIAGAQNWIPLDKFIALNTPMEINDWESTCGVQKACDVKMAGAAALQSEKGTARGGGNGVVVSRVMASIAMLGLFFVWY